MDENPHKGSSFDNFLKEDDIYKECTTVALEKVLAWQFKEAIKPQQH